MISFKQISKISSYQNKLLEFFIMLQNYFFVVFFFKEWCFVKKKKLLPVFMNLTLLVIWCLNIIWLACFELMIVFVGLGEEKHFELLQLLCKSLMELDLKKKKKNLLSAFVVEEAFSCYVVCSFFLLCFSVNLLMKRMRFVNLWSWWGMRA